MRAPPLLLLLLGLPLAAWSQAPAGAAAPSTERGEPRVERIVVEDKGVRIEELRVRGQTQRIVVRSKTGEVAAYEILVPEGSRNLSDSPAPTRGGSGQRVWNVLSF